MLPRFFVLFAKKGTKPTPYRESPYELFSRQDKKQQKQLQEKHDDQAKAYMGSLYGVGQ